MCAKEDETESGDATEDGGHRVDGFMIRGSTVRHEVPPARIHS